MISICKGATTGTGVANSLARTDHPVSVLNEDEAVHVNDPLGLSEGCFHPKLVDTALPFIKSRVAPVESVHVAAPLFEAANSARKSAAEFGVRLGVETVVELAAVFCPLSSTEMLPDGNA